MDNIDKNIEPDIFFGACGRKAKGAFPFKIPCNDALSVITYGQHLIPFSQV